MSNTVYYGKAPLDKRVDRLEKKVNDSGGGGEEEHSGISYIDVPILLSKNPYAVSPNASYNCSYKAAFKVYPTIDIDVDSILNVIGCNFKYNAWFFTVDKAYKYNDSGITFYGMYFQENSSYVPTASNPYYSDDIIGTLRIIYKS